MVMVSVQTVKEIVKVRVGEHMNQEEINGVLEVLKQTPAVALYNNKFIKSK